MKIRRDSFSLLFLVSALLITKLGHAGDAPASGESTQCHSEAASSGDVSIQEVKEGHPVWAFLDQEFLQLGVPYEFHVNAHPLSCKRGYSVILSAKAPHQMSQYRAEEFCKNMGARLPSKKEFLVLANLMGARDASKDDWQGYNPDRIPEIKGQTYWSSSRGQWRGVWDYFFWRYSLSGAFNQMSAYVFDGDGNPGKTIFWENYNSVRCAVTVR